MNALELLAVYVLLVLLSAAAGVARESLQTLRFIHRGGNGNETNRSMARLIERSDDYLLTILAANHGAKLASVCVLFLFFEKIQVTFISSIVLSLVVGSLIVLLVAELIPRHIARAHPEAACQRLSGLIRGLHFVLYPIGWVLSRLVGLLKRAFGIEGSIFPLPETSHELLELLEATEDNGRLQDDDRELITSIFEFRDTIVREVMVPRVDIACLEAGATLAAAQRLVVEKGHSRLPVYRDSLDNVVGVLYAKDLLAYAERGPLGEQSVNEALHEPMFVPETKRVAELLREFQRGRLHIAIVVDEYGGTSGLVTIEDLLEEIVGEIRDEYDTEPPLFETDGQGGFVVDAKMPICDIERDLGIVLPENEEYDTLGGYIFTRLGKVPAPGDVIQDNGIQITVLEADERRIHKARITPQTADDSSSEEGD